MRLVADNLQITDQLIQKAVDDLDPGPIQELVRRCEGLGAEAIDINSGPLFHQAARKMAFLVETVQAVSDLPILLDTANPEALAAGLGANRKRAVINGFSLEPQKLSRILPLAAAFHAEIVGYLLYPNGHVPPNGSERLVVALELYQAFKAAGLQNNHLILDPVLVPVTWQNGIQQATEVLSVLRLLPELLGFPVRTIAALSNLTTGARNLDKKEVLERTYLPMLAASGLSMLLLNMFHAQTVRTAKVCRLMTNPGVFAWEAVP